MVNERETGKGLKGNIAGLNTIEVVNKIDSTMHHRSYVNRKKL